MKKWDGDIILKIKKSHRNKEEWIVYHPDNFVLHTHCRSRRIALVIRNNVMHHRLPKSTDLRLLQSHIRVTKNKQYIRQLENRMEEIVEQTAWIKTNKRVEEDILAAQM